MNAVAKGALEMKWFRFYSEAMHDPKVQQLRPELFKFWVNCLCLANERAERGTLPNPTEIAFILRMKRSIVERFCTELVVENLLHGRPETGDAMPDSAESKPGDNLELTSTARFNFGFQVHQWQVRQPSSDDVAKRVRSYREKRSVKHAEPNVTLHVTPSNGTCNALDTDTELIPPTVPPRGEVRVRSSDDLKLVNEAVSLLGSDPRTEALAMNLGRMHDNAELVKLEGWRWLYAARWLLKNTDSPSKLSSIKYLTTIATNATLADLDARPRGKPGPEPTPIPPYFVGTGKKKKPPVRDDRRKGATE